jgi:hypothetical protein
MPVGPIGTNSTKNKNMTPLTENPTIVIRLDFGGQNVVATATNISPEIQVKVVVGKEDFDKEAAGLPFVVENR